MPDPSSLTELVQRHGQGDPEAGRQLFAHNAQRLSRLAEQYLMPVEEMSWEEAHAFYQRLSELSEERAAGRRYRLPTEAEWECGCRAGSNTTYSFGNSATELGNYAWYDANSENKTHPVGKKQPNAWGLYDMNGNVNEWCADWYGRYMSGLVTDPSGSSPTSHRVYRGASAYDRSWGCRATVRGGFEPHRRDYTMGFRVACDVAASSGTSSR
jgi:formylglycine-generating enzyme required for sulfatase activity